MDRGRIENSRPGPLDPLDQRERRATRTAHEHRTVVGHSTTTLAASHFERDGQRKAASSGSWSIPLLASTVVVAKEIG